MHYLESDVLNCKAHPVILQALEVPIIPPGRALAGIIPTNATDLIQGQHTQEFLSVQGISARRRMKGLHCNTTSRRERPMRAMWCTQPPS